ncbi:hypothetical protein SVAN01_09381 [Stagonosporopsis vannaccii]|nr:hypothetical protein SVAN01_09381 [Stagonosporopsis vannaccii]
MTSPLPVPTSATACLNPPPATAAPSKRASTDALTDPDRPPARRSGGPDKGRMKLADVQAVVAGLGGNAVLQMEEFYISPMRPHCFPLGKLETVALRALALMHSKAQLAITLPTLQRRLKAEERVVRRMRRARDDAVAEGEAWWEVAVLRAEAGNDMDKVEDGSHASSSPLVNVYAQARLETSDADINISNLLALLHHLSAEIARPSAENARLANVQAGCQALMERCYGQPTSFKHKHKHEFVYENECFSAPGTKQ